MITVFRGLIKMERLTQAYEFGKQAFEKGAICAPSADANFMKMFVEKSQKVGDSIEPAKAWQRGWNNANLKAPMPQ